MVILYCNQCGKQIPDHSRFCGFCGARVDMRMVSEDAGASEKPPFNKRKLEQEERDGTLVYLRDIVSIEFSVNELQRQLSLAQQPVILHDEWYYWKVYKLNPPLLWYSDYAPYNLMYMCYFYKLNKYYYALEKREVSNFYDMNGNEVHHRFGKPGYNLTEIDTQTRRKLCTLPEFRKRLFHDPELVNGDSVLWGKRPEIIRRNMENYGLEGFAQLKLIVEDFESQVRQKEERYSRNLPDLQRREREIKKELEQACELRNKLYSVNIIPSKFRNIGCAYFIYNFFSTSSTPLNNVFLHMDLDKIQSQLNTVINNQRESILQQAIIISQNEELLAQNQRLFEELSDMSRTVGDRLGEINTALGNISESSSETSKWARIAAANAEMCAWISAAKYIKN